MRRWLAAWRLKRRHKRAPRQASMDPADPRHVIIFHVLDGIVHVDEIRDTEACRFAEEEWQGYFIGERFCWTHGGHSTEEIFCPRHPDRVVK